MLSEKRQKQQKKQPSNLSERTRFSRIKEVLERLSDEELSLFALSRLCRSVSVWEFLTKKKLKPGESRMHANTVDILVQLNQLRNDLLLSEFSGPENIAFANNTTTTDTANNHPLEITPDNEKLLCEQILSVDSGRGF
jgi:hypothetical protein